MLYDFMEVMCETSMRHFHLTQAHVEALFGAGVKLEEERPLSQPGQYLSRQRVTLVGPKREIDNVAILGPVRKESQAELSLTDAFMLGMKNVPLRLSGNIDGTPGADLKGPAGTVKLDKGVIIAKRHVHLDTKTASVNDLMNGDIVKLRFGGLRAAILDEVVVRVDDSFAPAVHLDSDEGNAVFAVSGKVTIIK